MSRNVVPFSTFVVKVASRCNLNCSYCYMYNLQDQTYRAQPKRMGLEVAQKMAERIRSHSERHQSTDVHIILHGGEPMLVGMEYMHEWLTTVRRELGSTVRGHYSMQTNGLLITDEWIEFLADRNVGIGISYDGPKHAHDRYRVHHDGRGSHDEVIGAIEKIKRHRRGKEVFSSVLSVQLDF